MSISSFGPAIRISSTYTDNMHIILLFLFNLTYTQGNCKLAFPEGHF